MGSGLLNYDDAKKACEAQPSATLISIHSSEEQEFINTLIKEKNIPDGIWIGLRKENATFNWSDSTKFDFKNWDKESPSNTTLEDCVQMNPESLRLGKWSHELCTKSNLALCQKVIESSFIGLNKLLPIVKEIETSTLKILADNKVQMRNKYLLDIFKNDWVYLKTFNETDGKKKGLIFPIEENKNASTFDEAVKICNKFNSFLVEIKSWNKQIIVNSFLDHIKTSADGNQVNACFLNAKQVSKGTFKWLQSNSSFDYKNWYPDYPHTADGNDDTMLVLNMDDNFGKWFDNVKSYKFYVICEFDITD